MRRTHIAAAGVISAMRRTHIAASVVTWNHNIDRTVAVLLKAVMTKGDEAVMMILMMMWIMMRR
jgi:hypothetical protein